MKTAATNQAFLSDVQLAERFGISRVSIWRLAKTGELPAPVKLFRSTTRWRLADIEGFEAGLRSIHEKAG